MPIDDAIEALRFDRQFMTNVAAWERLPARPARYADFPPRLDPRMIRALRALEIAPRYTAGRAPSHPRPGESPDHQPRHAPHRNPAAPPALGEPSRALALDRGR